MTRVRLIVASIAALVVTACASPGGSTTTNAAASTTAPAQSTTALQAQIVDGGLMAFDPGTLVPVPGAEALVIADDHWGVVSPNGRWAAVQSWTAGATESQKLTIVDLDRHSAIEQVRLEPQGTYGLKIRDDGTAFWLTGTEMLTIRTLSQIGTQRLVDAELPVGFFADDLTILDENRLGLFGSVQTDDASETMVITVDIATGATTEYPLPSVTRGQIAELGEIDGQPVFEFAFPAAAFDLAHDRLLVAEATRDVITTLDLGTGEMEEHPWQRPVAFLDGLLAWLVPPAQAKGPSAGTSRSVYLTPDDSKLFVGTSVGSIEDEKEVRIPEEVVAIDTATWEVSIIPIKTDIIVASPDGRFLTAQGISYGVDDNFTPVYVVDVAAEEVVIEIPLGTSAPAETSFSADSAFAYVQTYDNAGTKIEILDLDMGQPVGAVEFREIDLIGEAGLLAFQLGP